MAKKPDPLTPYRQLGVVFTHQSGKDDQADCPFCGKTRAFHVNASRGVWICSSGPDRCGRHGNTMTFLEQMHEFCLDMTGAAEYDRLSEERGGIPPEAFEWAGVAWNPITGEWLIPSRNAEGHVRDIRHKRPTAKGLQGMAGCKANLWGSEQLSDRDRAAWPVDLCEGEWDGIALRWLNRRIGRKAIVLAVPGARGLPEHWLAAFKGRKVTWHYDKDADGEKFSALGGQKIKGVVREQAYTKWPEEFADKFDISDFVRMYALEGNPRKAYLKLAGFAVKKHWWKDPHATTDDVPDDAPKNEPIVREDKNISFQECIRVFKRHLVVSPDMEEAFRTVSAVVLANQLPDDPLWMYIVGPPSGGKTELLLSLMAVPDVSYHSSVSAKSMLSGYKVPGDEDPSLIPKLIGKIAVFKDWTEVLSAHEAEISALNGLLRGAYDGHIKRTYGNGQNREYTGTFNVLAGVTSQIHARNDTLMGERFLKFQLKAMSQHQQRRLIEQVLSTEQNPKRNEKLQGAARRFLNRDIPSSVPELEGWVRKKINALARFVAQLRTTVPWQRDGGDKFLAYEPDPEVGLRLAKQFRKFGVALAFVDGSKTVGEKQYPLIQRVAMDTAYGWPKQLLSVMLAVGPCSVETLAGEARMDQNAVRRVLRDMQAIGMVVKRASAIETGSFGRPKDEWHVSRTTQKLCVEVEFDAYGGQTQGSIASVGA